MQSGIRSKLPQSVRECRAFTPTGLLPFRRYLLDIGHLLRPRRLSSESAVRLPVLLKLRDPMSAWLSYLILSFCSVLVFGVRDGYVSRERGLSERLTWKSKATVAVATGLFVCVSFWYYLTSRG